MGEKKRRKKTISLRHWSVEAQSTVSEHGFTNWLLHSRNRPSSNRMTNKTHFMALITEQQRLPPTWSCLLLKRVKTQNTSTFLRISAPLPRHGHTQLTQDKWEWCPEIFRKHRIAKWVRKTALASDHGRAKRWRTDRAVYLKMIFQIFTTSLLCKQWVHTVKVKQLGNIWGNKMQPTCSPHTVLYLLRSCCSESW